MVEKCVHKEVRQIMRKDLVVAVLITFCLTAALFMIVPTSGGVWPYDPWWDVNGDGKIDVQDLARVSGAFATYGDPAKNVNVTNWPEDRPTVTSAKVQRIQILESLSSGVDVGLGSGSADSFLFVFEPIGQLVNVTGFYIMTVRKAPDLNAHAITYVVNSVYSFADVIDTDTVPRASWNHYDSPTGLHAGVNRLDIYKNALPTGLWLYKLEIIVEYFSTT
jgi:hypothetical protein